MSGSRWLEVLVITAAAPVLGSLIAPGDAYLLRAPFPWVALAPLLVALQHGLWAGLISALLLSGGAIWYVMALATVPAATLGSWSLGCVLLAVIAGQLRDTARARSRDIEQRSEELRDRLERSERTRHLIQLSHAKLVERIAASRSSLVAAIEGGQRRMSDARSMHELGQVLLDVLASQGNLHAASVYIVGSEPTTLVTQPVASLGGTGASSARHPLVVRARQSGRLAAIVDAGDPEPRDRSVLAAVPLITSARRVVGVVAVHQMPFMAFQAEHLQQLFVLAGHLADMLFDRWSALHETPVAVLPAAADGGNAPPVVQATVIEPAATQRTWRGMPAVHPQLAADVESAAPRSQKAAAGTQSTASRAEEVVMETRVTAATPPLAKTQSTVSAAEDPVSETVPIPSRQTSGRACTPPPSPDPNRIAAVIRSAVRSSKATVKGVAIGRLKPTAAGSALRARVRAIAQTRSESSR
jgi:hypothetical protein